MQHDQALQILESIHQATEGETLLQQQRRELLLLAVRYAHVRAGWRLASPTERRAMDAGRTVAHDALIEQCNILSRACSRAGRDQKWRRALGDDRKEIGDFACHLHCQLGIQAR
jgi:hypothetical protein